MTNKGNHGKFYALLRQMPEADKEMLVFQFSGKKTSSLREFSENQPREYRRMIDYMQTEVNKRTQAETKHLRSAILYRLQKYGIDTTNWNSVNRFMQQPRIAGKRLYELSVVEMKALIPKMESILAKEKRIQNEELRLSQCN